MKNYPTNVRAFVDEVEFMKVTLPHFGVNWNEFSDSHVITIPVTVGFVNDLIKRFYSNKKRYIENN